MIGRSSRAVILTGWSPRAVWQRWRIRRAYSRPVTFRDLRRIAYDADLREERGQLAAQAIFDATVCEAERGIVDHGEAPEEPPQPSAGSWRA